MDPYWFLFNPLVHNLLNIIFGILLVAGIGLLIMNLVIMILSHRYIGPLIGIIISLLLIGVSIKWEVILPIIAETMGGVVQYLGIYLYQLINQSLAQNTTTLAALLM